MNYTISRLCIVMMYLTGRWYAGWRSDIKQLFSSHRSHAECRPPATRAAAWARRGDDGRATAWAGRGDDGGTTRTDADVPRAPAWSPRGARTAARAIRHGRTQVREHYCIELIILKLYCQSKIHFLWI